jgi:hypothetical protein
VVLVLEGLRSLRIELRKKHGGHGDLRHSGRQSVIPYVHGECWCIVVCAIQALGLNLPKRVCLNLSSAQPFIVQGWAVTL